VLETLKQGGIRKLLVVEGSTSDPKVKEIVGLAKGRGVPVELVEKMVLDNMSETRHHQGVIALVEAPSYIALNRVVEKAGREPCVIILDGVQDPQNLGSILRTSDATGVDAVLIPKKEGVGLTPTVLRVSMGGGAHVPVARENIYPAVKLLKDEGFKLVAVDTSGDYDLWEEDLTGAVALVLGGEGEGISPTLLNKCDSIVRIPMHGHVSSLNVGVSAAVVLYERLRQLEVKRGQRST
ncbi:MAG: 23S rRNA (guanosine(2251)-2'-O)-methyltransferase RlmB, partial [Candidatus Bathyarchaeota archaeon]|nr:23S rRNA (guanosine(2251)-2'-O)-methyltransferase RlmB [Candidatus Bathyarchaeota archaeon]